MSDEDDVTIDDVPILVGMNLMRAAQERGYSSEEAIEAANKAEALAAAMVEASTHPDECACELCETLGKGADDAE